MREEMLSKIIEKHIYKNWKEILRASFGITLKKGLKEVIKLNAKQTAKEIVEEVSIEVNKILDKAKKV